MTVPDQQSDTDPPILGPETPIGGQAVVEGVMMRGPRIWAVAARRPDSTIATTDHPVPTRCV